MVQHKTYDKNCVICNKEFIAKRKHAETCSEACRAQKNANARALKTVVPALVAEAKAEVIEEIKQVLEGPKGAERAKILIKSLQEKYGALPDQPHYETEAYKADIKKIWKLE
jgi:hypothetical protein